jgi:hypothetical protein
MSRPPRQPVCHPGTGMIYGYQLMDTGGEVLPNCRTNCKDGYRTTLERLCVQEKQQDYGILCEDIQDPNGRVIMLRGGNKASCQEALRLARMSNTVFKYSDPLGALCRIAMARDQGNYERDCLQPYWWYNRLQTVGVKLCPEP